MRYFFPTHMYSKFVYRLAVEHYYFQVYKDFVLIKMSSPESMIQNLQKALEKEKESSDKAWRLLGLQTARTSIKIDQLKNMDVALGNVKAELSRVRAELRKQVTSVRVLTRERDAALAELASLRGHPMVRRSQAFPNKRGTSLNFG
jgi:hypothetical protein